MTNEGFVGFKLSPRLNKPDGNEILLICRSPEDFVMLKNEASANDGTDASFLSMTVPIKKIEMYSRTIGTEGSRRLLFKNLTLLMLEGRSGFVNPSP